MFSDYSGTVGTIYNVPSESKVVGQVKYIPTPGRERRRLRTSATRTASASPPRPSMWPAAVEFIKWMEQPANQAAFAGANGSQVRDPDLPAAVQPRRPQLIWSKSGKVPGAATLQSLLENHARADLPGRRAAVVRAVQQRGLHQHPQAAAGSGVGGRGDQRDRLDR